MSTDLGFSLFSGQQIESYILYVKYLEFSFSSGQANGNKKRICQKILAFYSLVAKLIARNTVKMF